MSARDDEYYDREERRAPRRSSGRYEDDYDDRYGNDYDDRPVRRSQSSTGRRPASSGNGASRNGSSRPSGSPAPRSGASRNGGRSGGSGGNGGGRNGGSGRSSGGNRKKKDNTKAVILLIMEVVVACLLIFLAYRLFFKVKPDEVKHVDINEEAITQSISEAAATNEQMLGYTNIALFGVDSRDEELTKNTRSDTIMIASINNDTGEIRLCSVYRDTYLNLSNDTYTKCNAAYAQGGPEQAISMLNMNLDMDIRDFVTIGFRGLTDVVDALGGVQIDLTDAEISHLNNYQSTMATELKLKYEPVTSSGLQTLNGLQATAYCRIRYTAGDDFRRAERQRTVLMACLEKAKGMSLSQLENVASKVFPETYTSLDLDDIFKLLKNIPKYTVVESNGFPNEDMRTTGTMGKAGSCVLPVDLQSNVKWLHEFLFDDSEYEVSSDVIKYSDRIKSDVGKYLSN